MYCTYLTTYSGNKLPPFYIGYSTVEKVKAGYHGSVASKRFKAIWKAELKEHNELFTTKILSVYSTGQEAKAKEAELQTKLNVLRKPEMYINRTIDGEKFYVEKHSPETRAKIGVGNRKPKRMPSDFADKFKGKKASPEARRKMSESHKKRYLEKPHRKWTEAEKLAMSEKKKDHVAWNKGLSYLTGNKHSAETKGKMRDARLRWLTEHTNPLLGRKHSEDTKAKMRHPHRKAVL